MSCRYTVSVVMIGLLENTPNVLSPVSGTDHALASVPMLAALIFPATARVLVYVPFGDGNAVAEAVTSDGVPAGNAGSDEDFVDELPHAASEPARPMHMAATRGTRDRLPRRAT